MKRLIPALVALAVLVGIRPFPSATRAAAQRAELTGLASIYAIALKPMNPGQGLLTVVAAPLGGPDGIAIAGGDDEGTLNAANELAANLPRLWGAAGARVAQAESQTAAYLKSRGAPGTVRGVTSMLVDSDRRGLARMTLR